MKFNRFNKNSIMPKWFWPIKPNINCSKEEAIKSLKYFNDNPDIYCCIGLRLYYEFIANLIDKWSNYIK